ncbi:glutamine-hydrolyzing carbamoyl-phosphate synthase small subunit [Citricoccus muralis]|uniref:Carbamoyl phosphate synthase small chain n=1 Tax=Citricoccus muralis TaxID=169134 RepID=A0ABY8H436_9MICC|nr:glutamine-hydrolyzing carbamoyl-phosphate synthase small subunit [Citricoccus muralis]WFP15418.1 glutamine-hydrolyzing carbamoyl-phosphate synthase small subunit [Citricoccus muralis]
MSLKNTEPAILVLEDGSVFEGRSYGVVGSTLGEAVFTTGMTGYQETLTDPSYARQIVVQTFPHIGNTGVNDEDNESRAIWVAGYAVRDAARVPSNYRSQRSLDDQLVAEGIVGIQGIDTRAVTRLLRDRGSMKAGIFSGDAAQRSQADLLTEVREQPPMAGARLAEAVTTEQAYVVEPAEHGYQQDPQYTVVAVDLGIKAATPRHLASRGVRVHVVPATTTFDEIQALNPDGVFLSNGPGDPATADSQVQLLRQVLDADLPFFGICFGNQIFGRALGFDTYKLPFGHRGPNQPVMDKATGKVHITSQNHGFAVEAPIGEVITAPEARYGEVEVSHWSLNDQVVEGLSLTDRRAFSVQFHPESAAGPHDAHPLFDRFIDNMAAAKSDR